jgi:hypothetical protein
VRQDDDMLELRPLCEHCATELPPDSPDARICSYECTFCATCVEQVLGDVCPNCGGAFQVRPVRPVNEWLPGVSLASQPATTHRHHKPVDAVSHAALRRRVESGALR